jgi:hypothetical protein
LDELVGTHVAGESPEIHWEDTHALFSFDTEEEARNAIRDPYYQRFMPEADWTSAEIKRVQVYKPYSTDLNATWQLIEHVTKSKPLNLQRDGDEWVASFGIRSEISAKTAPIAICLAALRSLGIEVEMERDFSE